MLPTGLPAAHPRPSTWRSLAPALAVFTVGYFCLASVATAHSWYPRTCCNELDCSPVDRIERLAGGGMRLTVGHFEVLVPAGFPSMPSQDNRVHVCVYRNMQGQYLPRCLFMPGVS